VAVDDLLSARSGAVSAHATVTLAALLAADVAGAEGFRPTDVRFFFLLFTNWMEDDHLRPGLDIDLTQVRRALARLVAEGHATVVGGGRAPRYALVPAGVLALVEALTDARAPRTFEEVVFLATAAASYRDAIADRARGAPRAADRIVRARLDPVRILRAERRRLEGAVADLEERVASGLRMEAVARAAEGEAPGALAERLRAEVGGYQLHPMRSLGELVAVLPPAMARFELGPGMGLRARALFAPLLEQMRARVAILERLERTVAG
jgi:hypothetical protein